MADSALRRVLVILAQPDILSRLRNTPNYPLHTVKHLRRPEASTPLPW